MKVNFFIDRSNFSLLRNKNKGLPSTPETICVKGVAIKNAALHPPPHTPSVMLDNLGVELWNLGICIFQNFPRRPLCP